MALAVVCLFLIAEGTKVFNYWWLAVWLGDGNGSPVCIRTIYRQQGGMVVRLVSVLHVVCLFLIAEGTNVAVHLG